MKSAPFNYHDPTTIEEAVALLAGLQNARLLAGGQSLVPMLNFRLVQPDHLVDLNRISALAGIRVQADRIELGAMTRQRDLERCAALTAACPVMLAALAHVGHRQTRNRGTIGGSLCHLDPAAELVNVAALHGARFTARSPGGERTLTFDEFAQGYLSNGLAQGELLTAITVPRWPDTHGYGFEEVARRHGDFAIAAAGALIELDDSGCIQRAAICVSGVETLPARLAVAERSLLGERPSHDLLRAAAVEGEKLDAVDDAYVSARYRKHLARVLVYRALERAVADARGKVVPHA